MRSLLLFFVCLIIAINGDEGSRRLLRKDACAAATCPACTECKARRNGKVHCKKIKGCCTTADDCNGRRSVCNKGQCERNNNQCPQCTDPCSECGIMPEGTTCKTTPGTSINGCPACPQLSDGFSCPVGSCTFCGGIAGIQCPDTVNQDCIDNPFDDCDPKNGGADCGGCCQFKTVNQCPLIPCANPGGLCGLDTTAVLQTYFNPDTGCTGCPELVECAPVLDCSAVSCLLPKCDGPGESLETPEGECCPQCVATGCKATTGCKVCDVSGTDACNSEEIQITSCDPNTCPEARIGCDTGYAPFNVGECCGCFKL